MAENINSSKKANYPVGRADGLKMGSANTVYTTPDPSFGRYISGYTSEPNSGNIFGSEAEH